MRMDVNEKIFALAENFSASAKILIAISDETRQHLIVEMMKMGHCMGVRVGEITERTNLSRPSPADHERCWDCESAERGNEKFLLF